MAIAQSALLRILGLVVVVLSSTVIARAQAVAAFVNGDPITSYDIDQRIKIMQLATRTTMSRQQALEQLIDDKVKIIEARRVGYRIKDENLDDKIASIASGNGQTVPEFMATLARAGVESAAYKLKIRADFSWDLALSQKFKTSNAANSSEVKDVFEEKVRSGAARVTDYIIHTVIFVVPRTGEGVAQREREANAARATFQSCDEGLANLRKIRDVAIKTPVKRTSNQLPAQFAKLLADTPIGRLTPPIKTTQGIELYAVCGKEERVDETSVRTQVENELNTKRSAARAEEYLKATRKNALIEYKSH